MFSCSCRGAFYQQTTRLAFLTSDFWRRFVQLKVDDESLLCDYHCVLATFLWFVSIVKISSFSTFRIQYPQRPLHDENKSYAPHLPRSFIRPSTVATSNSTGGRGLPKSSSRKVDINGMTQEKRTDPVKKFNAYNQAWKQTKPPGEKNRNQLRWKIRVRHSFIVVQALKHGFSTVFKCLSSTWARFHISFFTHVENSFLNF